MKNNHITPNIRAEFLHLAGPMLAQSGHGGRAEMFLSNLFLKKHCEIFLSNSNLQFFKNVAEQQPSTHQDRYPQIQEVQGPG